MEKLELRAYGTDEYINLMWSRMENVTGYNVYVKQKGKWLEMLNVRGTSAKISTANAGVTYTFKVASYVFQNNKTYITAESDPVITVPVAVPANVYASAGGSGVKVFFEGASKCDGYKISIRECTAASDDTVTYGDSALSGGESGEAGAVGNERIIYVGKSPTAVSGLTPGVTYDFRVCAFIIKHGTEYSGLWSESARAAAIPRDFCLAEDFITLTTGGSFTLRLVRADSENEEETAEAGELTWSSSDTGVAKVDKNGVVTGGGDGFAVVV